MIPLISYESRTHSDLEQLERTLVTAHRICADGVDLPRLAGAELRNWYYSWCYVLERLLREVANQKAKVKR